MGLGHQKSQSGGTGLPPAEAEMTPYHRFASLVSVPEKESSFFDGIDVSLVGIASLAQGGDSSFLKTDLSQINSLVDKAMNDFSAQHPEAIASTLAAGLKQTNELIEKVASSDLTADSKYDVTHELRVKQAQFENALAESLGISVLATVASEKEPTWAFRALFQKSANLSGGHSRTGILGENPRNESHQSSRGIAERGPRVSAERTMVHRSRDANGRHAQRQSVRGSAVHGSRRGRCRFHAPLFHASKYRAVLL